MKSQAKLITGGCLATLLIGAVGLGVILWFVVPAFLPLPASTEKEHMWRTTHEWTRTAPLPPEAQDPQIHSKGSAFTRQFRASFQWRDKAALKSWIAASPGLSDAKVTTEADGTRVYQIKPGGGAGFAEIRIHPDLRVEINTFWS
jgi:hypothetical protein